MKRHRGQGQPHIAVVGAGAFGGWTALHLRQSGAEVTPGNSRASSGDETRVIRSICGPDEIYVALVQRAFELWRGFEESRGLKLYHRTGALWMFDDDDAYARASLPFIAARALRVDRLEPAQVQRRFPQVSMNGITHVYLEEEAGYLLARRACEAVVAAFVGTPANDPRFEQGQLPVWVDKSANAFYYGIPGSERRGFKFGDDAPGAAFDPTHGERIPSGASIDAARRYRARRFPALARAPLVEARVCQYELSPDRHYIVDRHPDAGNAWIAGGGSGHGFKLGPAIGEHLAACVLERATPAPQFALARLALPQPRPQFALSRLAPGGR